MQNRLTYNMVLKYIKIMSDKLQPVIMCSVEFKSELFQRHKILRESEVLFPTVRCSRQLLHLRFHPLHEVF